MMQSRQNVHLKVHKLVDNILDLRVAARRFLSLKKLRAKISMLNMVSGRIPVQACENFSPSFSAIDISKRPVCRHLNAEMSQTELRAKRKREWLNLLFNIAALCLPFNQISLFSML